MFSLVFLIASVPFSASPTTCIPNFALQEYPKGELEPPKSEIIKQPLRAKNGFLIIPDTPSIGMGLAADAKERYPFKPRRVQSRLHIDGSVIDQQDRIIKDVNEALDRIQYFADLAQQSAKLCNEVTK